MLTVLLISAVVFLMAMAAMAVGLIIRNRALRKRCVGCTCEAGEREEPCSTRQNAWH